jgi:hypothetical protein
MEDLDHDAQKLTNRPARVSQAFCRYLAAMV